MFKDEPVEIRLEGFADLIQRVEAEKEGMEFSAWTSRCPIRAKSSTQKSS